MFIFTIYGFVRGKTIYSRILIKILSWWRDWRRCLFFSSPHNPHELWGTLLFLSPTFFTFKISKIFVHYLNVYEYLVYIRYCYVFKNIIIIIDELMLTHKRVGESALIYFMSILKSLKNNHKINSSWFLSFSPIF